MNESINFIFRIKNTFSPLLTSHILPFLHDSSLDSKLSTGHTFSDICMTSRHETMTWHDGVMRLARVTGSCHGLRDSIVTLRDGAVTSAVSATALPLCSYHCLQYQSLLNMMGTFHKSHGLTGSFICPLALNNTRSGVWDPVSDDGCAMDMGRGDVTSDNETCVGVTTERAMEQWWGRTLSAERDSEMVWHCVTRDMWCAHWHVTPDLSHWAESPRSLPINCMTLKTQLHKTDHPGIPA